MQLKVSKIPEKEPEEVEIRCHRISDEVQELIAFVRSRQGVLSGTKEGRTSEVPVGDVCYFESVDNRTYIYTVSDCFETGFRIYEIEEMLSKGSFVRVQKGMILNLLKVKSIKPGLSGRYVALLKNNEEIIISRKYVPEFKKILKGGERQ
ncbi:MAG: LytTR family transcriptional regulator [Lachnospiraceae bacterium]|nr:LytTR family transcriptional regulator [Lachnospiraceae bacterium]